MNKRLFTRGGRLYLDCQENGTRKRVATGLKDGADNRAFCKQHFALFFKDKEKALSYHKDFVNAFFDKKANKERQSAKELKFDIERLTKCVLSEKSELKKFTRKHLENAFLKLIDFCNKKGVSDVRKITRELVGEYANFLRACELKTNTRRNLLFALKALLDFALQNDFITKNPFFMPKMRADETKFEPFSLDEAQMLIKAANGELKSYLIVAFFTGARTGEILGMKWGDIDFEKDEIHILRTKHPSGFCDSPKTRSSLRAIDMLAPVKCELQGLKFSGDDEFIFAKSRAWFEGKFFELLKSLNLENRRLYDTRSSFASIMLSKGEEPMWVGCKMMGHSNLNTTYKAYAKYIPKPISTRASFVNELDLGVDEPNLFENLA